jgi:hypothetical protein
MDLTYNVLFICTGNFARIDVRASELTPGIASALR